MLQLLPKDETALIIWNGAVGLPSAALVIHSLRHAVRWDLIARITASEVESSEQSLLAISSLVGLLFTKHCACSVSGQSLSLSLSMYRQHSSTY